MQPRQLLSTAAIVCFLVVSLAATSALACPACALGLAPRSLAQQLADSDRAVLARPVPGEVGRLTVVATVTGEHAPGEAIIEAATATDATAREPGRALLLVREPRSTRWTSLGSIKVDHAAVLRQIAAFPPAETLSTTERVERLRFFHNYLEHPEPLLTRAAYEDVAGSPYSAMKSLKPALDNKPALDVDRRRGARRTASSLLRRSRCRPHGIRR